MLISLPLQLVMVMSLGTPEAGPYEHVSRSETNREAEAVDANRPPASASPAREPRTMLLEAGYDPSSINLDAQQSPSNETTDEIVLADGDVIRGRILSETDEEVVIQHPVFDELRIPRSRIVAIRKNAPQRSTADFAEVVTGAGVRPQSPIINRSSTTGARQEETAGEDSEETESAKKKLSSTMALMEPENWSLIIGTAFGYVNNVNDELNVRLSAQAEHNSEFARLRIDSAYFLNSANNVIIDNDVMVGTTQDWFFPGSDWSVFAKGTYQWDQFESWEHRLSGYLGPGYKLVDSEDLAIDLRIGAGATYEYTNSQIFPEALFSIEWNWAIDDRQRFNGTSSYAPDVTNFDQYRISLNAEWNFRLQKEKGLSFYIGVRNMFQSIVEEGSTNNDLRLFGGVKYEF